MMRNHVDQNLRGRADRLPLLLRLIDQRFAFSVQALRLFDDRLCSIEKIEQRLGRWQGFLDLLELCVAKAGNVADELDEPVFQHCLTSLVASRFTTRARTCDLTARIDFVEKLLDQTTAVDQLVSIARRRDVGPNTPLSVGKALIKSPS